MINHSKTNHVILTGNLGNAPKSWEGKFGICVSASLATVFKEKEKENDDQDNNNPDWHYLTFYGGEAKRALQLLEKGDFLSIEGRLRYFKRRDETTGFEYRTAVIRVFSFKLIAKSSASTEEKTASPDEPVQ